MKKATLILGVISFFVLFSGVLHADFIVLGPSDFSPHDPDEGDWYIPSLGDYIYPESGATTRYLSAELHLPKGSVIDRLKVYYYDNGSSHISVSMYRHKLSDATYLEMGSWESLGSASFLREASFGSLFNKKVWMSYRYLVRIYFGEGGGAYRIYAVKIEYHPPTP